MKALFSLLTALISFSVHAGIVLHDDFGDGILDTTKWSTDTSLDRSAVVERSPQGYVESINRGHLTTTGDWKPGTTPHMVLSVTGKFRLPNEGATAGDKLSVATRSSGAIRSGLAGGNCQECVEFGLARYDFGFGTIMWLDLHLSPNQDITLAYRQFTVSSDWYWFKVEDDGFGIRVWIDPLGDFLRAPDLEATTNHAFAVNHVSFYGRPYEAGSDHVTQFDDITIDMPEPSSAFLTLAGLGVLAISRNNAMTRRRTDSASSSALNRLNRDSFVPLRLLGPGRALVRELRSQSLS